MLESAYRTLMHKPDNVIQCLYSLVSAIGKVEIGSGERQDDSGQGFVGLGLVVLVDTPAAPRVEEADQVTGHRAEPFILMRVPAAFLLDYLVPCLHEVLDGPATIRQRRARAGHGICGQSHSGQRRADGTPTEQESARAQRPAPSEHPRCVPMGTSAHIAPNRTIRR